MRRYLSALAVALVALSGAARVGTQTFSALDLRHATLAVNFDLDGAANTSTAVLNASTIADSNEYVTSVTQPDVCRLLNVTMVDADTSITAGTVTMTGTDCLGFPRICTYDMSSKGSTTGAWSVSYGPDGSSCYLKTITSVLTGVVTGEGGAADTLSIGYSDGSANAWTAYGVVLPPGPFGEHGVDLFDSYPIGRLITTSGVSTTTVASVNTDGPFTNVAVGDLLQFNVVTTGGGAHTYQRKVTARASANSITVNSAVKIPAAGVTFTYQRFFVTRDPLDQVWIPTRGYRALTLDYRVAANANTGGVIATLECNDDQTGAGWPTAPWVTVGSLTTASGATQAASVTALGPVILQESYFGYCRVGLKFGTADDADSAVEDISLDATLSK